LIVARMAAQNTQPVAEIFAESDATDLPHELGVTARALFTFNDLYLHLIDWDDGREPDLEAAARHPLFQRVSGELRPYIQAYDPGWRGPRDAMARQFYQWSAQ
jgi:cyclase